jgi:pimeloyl-ACP methyl ester carboxylesterase
MTSAPTLAVTATHDTAPTQFIDANGIRFAYRRVGVEAGVPLVFLQHFTGTMDNWDPSVVDGFAGERPVVLFDNAGVSRSSGATPNTVRAMADDTVAFIEALGLTQVDLLGFSLGGFVAQVVAAEHPGLVRRIILAGTGPEGGEGIQNIGSVVERGLRESPEQPRLYLFFERSERSQRAGRAFIERQAVRTDDRDPDISAETYNAQLAAIVAWGTSQTGGAATRLGRITQPVLVVNGKTDVMVPTSNSYALFQGLPDATVILYQDSGHGALFQYAEEFVREGLRFLEA